MKQYRLKNGQENFDVVDGPHAGKKYEKGKVYTDIPENERRRFAEIKPVPAKAAAPNPGAETGKKE